MMNLTKSRQRRSMKANPYLEANFISRATLWWMIGFVRAGYKKPLEDEDMYDVLPDQSARTLAEKAAPLLVEDNKNTNKSTFMLLLELFWVFRKAVLYEIILFILQQVCYLALPFILMYLVEFFSDNNIPDWKGHIYALVLFWTQIVWEFTCAHSFHILYVLGGQWKAMFSTLVYEKILSLPQPTLHRLTSGTIINLLSTDVEKFHISLSLLPYIVFGPLEVFVLVSLLYMDLGWVVFVGMASVIPIVMVQVWSSKRFANMRKYVAEATDKRVEMMNEIIKANRVIKMYCWEEAFAVIISKLRAKEVKNYRKMFFMKSIATGLEYAPSKLAGMVIFCIYIVVTGHALTFSAIVKTLALLEALRVYIFRLIPIAIQLNGQMYASFKRITNFLALKTSKKSAYLQNIMKCSTSLQLHSVTVNWEDNNVIEEKPALKDLTFLPQETGLTIITGHVGSGKTSVFLTVLEELLIINGVIQKPLHISYTSQEPWVFSGTVRENVLFGSPLVMDRYRNVVQSCALDHDLAIMPEGDNTLVGERGLTLSGGQKARISLARAVYKEADLYLLDDPLSAVDTKIGRNLFNLCIKGFLSGKQTILITHQTQYLKQADKIYIMKDRSFVFQGIYQEIKQHHIASFQVMNDDFKDTDDDKATGTYLEYEKVVSDTAFKDLNAPKNDRHHVGSVNWKIYWAYIKSGGSFLAALVIITAALAQTCFILSDWWILEWTRELQDLNSTVVTNTTSNLSQTLIKYPVTNTTYVYIGTCLITILLKMIRNFIFFQFAANASQKLHDDMFMKVLRTPVSFMDRNPVGQVVNRFSRDMGYVDDRLPIVMFEVVDIGLGVISAIILNCIINPWLLLILAVFLIALGCTVHFAMPALRDMKRLDAASKSPIYSHLSETLQGLVTIRTGCMKDQCIDTFLAYQDEHTSRWYMHISAFRWFGLTLASSLNFFITVTAFVSVALKSYISAAKLGLSLTHLISQGDIFQYSFRQAVEVESAMTSAERILEYSELEEEAAKTNQNKPQSSWPENGIIVFEHVTLTYKMSNRPSLQDICCRIKSEEKIGIVGRTGAGKSSLLQAMMRLTEIDGHIWIDGIDITTIGLKDLREKISVIPQDPVLFSGTLRGNLDPCSEYPDDELWSAIKKVQLGKKVDNMAEGLNLKVTEGGSNLSVGERQLVCLARAIIKTNKILVLDEATANVDNKTDSLIQETVRDHFKDCTVLTIAHRLHTIIDVDRVMVLDEGQLVEFDTSYNLIKKGGCFSDLVKKTGEKQAALLRSIAMKIHARNKIIECTSL